MELPPGTKVEHPADGRPFRPPFNRSVRLRFRNAANNTVMSRVRKETEVVRLRRIGC